MPIAFPTRPTARGTQQRAPQVGYPHRADHCTCEQPVIADGECARCGRHTIDVINGTWQRRARQIGRRKHERNAR